MFTFISFTSSSFPYHFFITFSSLIFFFFTFNTIIFDENILNLIFITNKLFYQFSCSLSISLTLTHKKKRYNQMYLQTYRKSLGIHQSVIVLHCNIILFAIEVVDRKRKNIINIRPCFRFINDFRCYLTNNTTLCAVCIRDIHYSFFNRFIFLLLYSICHFYIELNVK